jgi:hypothetical protein
VHRVHSVVRLNVCTVPRPRGGGGQECTVYLSWLVNRLEAPLPYTARERLIVIHLIHRPASTVASTLIYASVETSH